MCEGLYRTFVSGRPTLSAELLQCELAANPGVKNTFKDNVIIKFTPAQKGELITESFGFNKALCQ